MSLQEFIGKKEGMTRIFDKKGNVVVCTIVSSEKNVVTQLKNAEKDGYEAIQVGYLVLSDSKKKNLGKPLQGHFAKAKVEPRKVLYETRVEKSDAFQIGQDFGCEIFVEDEFVDVTGFSKGKGTQGTMKRYNFAGGRASHGNSRYHRGGGSTGMRSTPGRVLPLQKKAGRMGGEKVTVESRIVRVDVERQVLLISGSLPGCNGGIVRIKKSQKKQRSKKS